MVTIYHNLDPDAGQQERPQPRSLELAGIVHDTNDPAEAFDRVIHRDGENWTDGAQVTAFGDRRGRRSSQEGDVFVAGDGSAHLVLPLGFRDLPGLHLPFLA